MVSYAPDHAEDTYRLYNLETRKVIQSSDVKGAEWSKMKPQDGISIFEKQPELLEQESYIQKSEEYETVDLDEVDYKEDEFQSEIKEDAKKVVQRPVVQQKVDTRVPDEVKAREEKEKQAKFKARKLVREMAALEIHNKRILRSSSKQAHVTVKHTSGEEQMHMVNFADLGIPEPRTSRRL